MLTNLSVRNIVLIDSLDIQLSNGLCVLTGETGAGKSILMGALGFVLGGRGSLRLLRHGEKQGSVTAVFAINSNIKAKTLLQEMAIDFDDELFIRRVIYADGRTKAFINDSPVGVALVQKLSEHLIEIHGQHDQKTLMDESRHITMLDRFGNLEQDIINISELYNRYKTALEQLNQTKQQKESLSEQESYLRYVVEELEKLSPVVGEEEKLATTRDALMNKEKLIRAVSETSEALSGNTHLGDKLREAQSILSRYSEFNDNFSLVIDALERSAIELEDALDTLNRTGEAIELDDNNLEQVEERLFALRATARKYNVTVNDLPDFNKQAQEKLALMTGGQNQLEALENNVIKTKEAYMSAATILSSKRQEVAVSFEKALHKELVPLKMEAVTFKVTIQNAEEAFWSPIGTDMVRFVASTNPGAPLAPLSKISSGGELSRFMLAMQVILQNAKAVPFMIFDEVDTGVGGAVAEAVGKRLELLGKQVQILVITHQPQVAARGNFHLKATKLQSQGSTKTVIIELDSNQRKQELGRMLSGEEITTEALAAAESLLKV